MPKSKRITPLAIRRRQERLYTMYAAQEVADRIRSLTREESLQLDRYARWHFGFTFATMVKQCEEMNEYVGGNAPE